LASGQLRSFHAGLAELTGAPDSKSGDRVEISGGTPAAHYVSDLKEFFGTVFPMTHRIFSRQPDGHSVPEPLDVSIDMDQIVLS
jgi:hypothetical protein